MGDLISRKEYKNPMGLTIKANSKTTLELLSEMGTSNVRKIALKEDTFLSDYQNSTTNGKIGWK